MKIIPIFRAEIVEGKIRVRDKEEFRHWIPTLKKDLRFQVWNKGDKRSLPQNSLWHGVVCKVWGDTNGLLIDEACQNLKMLVGRPWYYEKGNKFYTKSTAEATRDELTELIDLAVMKAAEQGCVISTNVDIK